MESNGSVHTGRAAVRHVASCCRIPQDGSPQRNASSVNEPLGLHTISRFLCATSRFRVFVVLMYAKLTDRLITGDEAR